MLNPFIRRYQLEWCELVFARPLSVEAVLHSVRVLASDPTMAMVVLEARATKGKLRFLLGAKMNAINRVARGIGAAALRLSLPRQALNGARRLGLSSSQRALDCTAIEISTKAILEALAGVQSGEELALQVVLGTRISGFVVPTDVRKPVPLYKMLLGYDPKRPEWKLSSEERKSLIAKVGAPNFQAVVRLGVKAGSPERGRNLVLTVLGALRLLEVPGLKLHLEPNKAGSFGDGSVVSLPRRLPLRLNISEVAALSAWPVGTDELPGLPSLHPRLLAPKDRVRTDKDRFTLGKLTAPAALDSNGRPKPLTISPEALKHHLHVIGPTGVGKSVLLEHLALQAAQQGLGLVVIEPKGDLVDGILKRLPTSRHDDVVVLDPSDPAGIVGLNPLAGKADPAIRAERVLAIFVDLFGDDLGVRTTDILHSCLLTLAQRPEASLTDIPRLLTDPAFRRKFTGGLGSDMALGSFWAWYENLSTAERATVIAPLMNKLRAVLLKPAVRRVLGQAAPRFNVRQVFTENKILLVPLSSAELGSLGASLLGSLVVAQIWEAAKGRGSLPLNKRPLVPVIIDECQQLMHLPIELAEALAMARSFGAGFVLSNQYFNQVSRDLRSALLSNVRSRVAFQCNFEDAGVLARLTDDGLEPRDFMGLGTFEIYAAIMEQGRSGGYVSGRTLPSLPVLSNGKAIRKRSAKRYGRTAAEIEDRFSPGPEKASDDGIEVEVESEIELETVGKRKRRTP
jgi:hypothetical protein